MSALTPGQRTFVSVLAGKTGLDPRVLTAWTLAEESSGAAQSRQAAGNHDWLNIGYTDAGQRGTGNSVWHNPVSAANATAAWMSGKWAVPGFGHAAPGITRILATAGKSPDAQINAIVNSGWASSGYNGGATLRSLMNSYGHDAPAPGARATPPAVRTPRGRSQSAQAPQSGGVDWQAAGLATLLRGASKPIDTSGKVTSDHLLTNLVSAGQSGLYDKASTEAPTTAVPTMPKRVRGMKLPAGAINLKLKGVGTFDGKQVADWIIPALQYAKAHGWKGSVNSGYRSYADQKRIYDSGVRPAAVPGTSNHEGDAFPRGAVDVTDAAQLSAILAKSPWKGVLVWAGAKDPVHFSHPHNGGY